MVLGCGGWLLEGAPSASPLSADGVRTETDSDDASSESGFESFEDLGESDEDGEPAPPLTLPRCTLCSAWCGA